MRFNSIHSIHPKKEKKKLNSIQITKIVILVLIWIDYWTQTYILSSFFLSILFRLLKMKIWWFCSHKFLLPNWYWFFVFLSPLLKKKLIIKSLILDKNRFSNGINSFIYSFISQSTNCVIQLKIVFFFLFIRKNYFRLFFTFFSMALHDIWKDLNIRCYSQTQRMILISALMNNSWIFFQAWYTIWSKRASVSTRSKPKFRT